MSLEKAVVDKALVKKGFKKIDSGKDHHWYYFLDKNGKVTNVRTKISHGSKKYRTLGDELISKISKQLFLTKQQFNNFVTCSYSEESFRKYLETNDHIKE